jgi:hypothetical protein
LARWHRPRIRQAEPSGGAEQAGQIEVVACRRMPGSALAPASSGLFAGDHDRARGRTGGGEARGFIVGRSAR